MKNIDKTVNDMNKVFQDMNKVFQDMDNIFKQVEKTMEDAIESSKAPRPWKAWFAWRPVTVKGKRIWLKTVYRRSTNTYVNHDDWTQYEYGDMFDVLKDAGK